MVYHGYSSQFLFLTQSGKSWKSHPIIFFSKFQFSSYDKDYFWKPHPSVVFCLDEFTRNRSYLSLKSLKLAIGCFTGFQIFLENIFGGKKSKKNKNFPNEGLIDRNNPKVFLQIFISLSHSFFETEFLARRRPSCHGVSKQ